MYKRAGCCASCDSLLEGPEITTPSIGLLHGMRFGVSETARFGLTDAVPDRKNAFTEASISPKPRALFMCDIQCTEHCGLAVASVCIQNTDGKRSQQSWVSSL